MKVLYIGMVVWLAVNLLLVGAGLLRAWNISRKVRARKAAWFDQIEEAIRCHSYRGEHTVETVRRLAYRLQNIGLGELRSTCEEDMWGV